MELENETSWCVRHDEEFGDFLNRRLASCRGSFVVSSQVGALNPSDGEAFQRERMGGACCAEKSVPKGIVIHHSGP